MNKQEFHKLRETVLAECLALLGACQQDYAHGAENPFANFERLGARLGQSREDILLVYMEKHIDGIHSWAKGISSNREPVNGRINDAINYLVLLGGMLRGLKFKKDLPALSMQFIRACVDNAQLYPGADDFYEAYKLASERTGVSLAQTILTSLELNLCFLRACLVQGNHSLVTGEGVNGGTIATAISSLILLRGIADTQEAKTEEV